jgi:hypothetical protein
VVTRYGRALEHVRVARGLWDSYEDDAFPRIADAFRTAACRGPAGVTVPRHAVVGPDCQPLIPPSIANVDDVTIALASEAR